MPYRKDANECQYCKECNLQIVQVDREYQVECCECGVRGPKAGNENRAIKLWNRMKPSYSAAFEQTKTCRDLE